MAQTYKYKYEKLKDEYERESQKNLDLEDELEWKITVQRALRRTNNKLNKDIERLNVDFNYVYCLSLIGWIIAGILALLI